MQSRDSTPRTEDSEVGPDPITQQRDSAPTGRIVVGVDGSQCSIDALQWAARQAELTGATIDAVISWEYPTPYGMEFGVLDVDWAATAQTALDTALHQAFGPDVEMINGRVIRGRPAEVLVAEAAGAELLVVGSRGHGAMAGMLLGSVSEHVVAHAPCPVLVIRHTTGGPKPPQPLRSGRDMAG